MKIVRRGVAPFQLPSESVFIPVLISESTKAGIHAVRVVRAFLVAVVMLRSASNVMLVYRLPLLIFKGQRVRFPCPFASKDHLVSLLTT